MDSKEEEKKPPISRLKLVLIFIFLDIVLIFVLRLFIEDFPTRIIILFAILLPIYYYLNYKFYHKSIRKRWWRPKKREGTHCPHHPEEQIVTQCKSCNIPICTRCHAFKMERRDYFRNKRVSLNHKKFDEPTCIDCILKQLEIVSKLLYFLAPIGLIAGIGLILAVFYIPNLIFIILLPNLIFIMLLILGISLLLVGIVSTINIFYVIPEIKRVEKQFLATI